MQIIQGLKTLFQIIGLFPQVYGLIQKIIGIVKKQKAEALEVENQRKLDELQKAKKESEVKNAAENYIDGI